jgi:hypothetical protein
VAKALTQPVEPDDATATPALSVCLLTAGPTARVAALLALVRPVADELVVALDDRADDETTAALSAVADYVVRYPYREPVDRSLRWLFSLCRGDWILNLDDDEVPGADLLEALPRLVGATDVTHYWLLRRWLWPDAGRVLAEHPWSTDYQLRLVRNDPLLLRFPSETHRPIEALGPHRFLRLPLYHADLVLNPRERREEKARKYEAQRPGKRVAGEPMNHVFHLPERRPEARTEPLPEQDRRLVSAVLEAATAPEPTGLVGTVQRAGEGEIDELWAGRGTEHAGRMELLAEPERLRAGEQRTLDVRVENRGGTTWPWGERGEPEVRLSYAWLDQDGNLLEYGLRTPLPADLTPGASQVVPVHVVAPVRAGRYRLRLDLVHEHVAWFGCAVERAVNVEPRLRVALLGEGAALERTLARLPDEAPAFEPVVLAGAGPAPRFGPPRAPDLREYLLHDTVPGRLRDWGPILARSLSLERVARRRRAGREVRPLLHGGQAFLDALAGCTHLLVVAGEPRAGLRERWLERMTLAAARRLGVAVVHQRPGELGLQ